MFLVTFGRPRSKLDLFAVGTNMSLYKISEVLFRVVIGNHSIFESKRKKTYLRFVSVRAVRLLTWHKLLAILNFYTLKEVAVHGELLQVSFSPRLPIFKHTVEVITTRRKKVH